MSYCIMRISKIKSFDGQGGMGDRFRHNMRLYDVINADHAISYMNRQLIDLDALDYEEAFYRNVREYEKAGIETKIRKNAILAFEVMLTYSRDMENIDLDKWCDANIKWLNDTFNKDSLDKEHQNVISAVLHMDETTPHIHAIVIPRDEAGNLNGTYYVENAEKMRALQTSYANYMKDFSLQRGLEHSVSSRTAIKDFYASLDKVYKDELPKPLENESLEQYYERANQEYVNSHLNALGKELDLKRQLEEEQTKNIQGRFAIQKIERLENHLPDDLRDDSYDIICCDVKDMELLKKGVKNSPENEKLKEALDICKEFIERQRQLELLRDALLYEKTHSEYEPYGV